MLRALGYLAALLVGGAILWVLGSPRRSDPVEIVADRTPRVAPAEPPTPVEQLALLAPVASAGSSVVETLGRQAGHLAPGPVSDEEDLPPAAPPGRLLAQLFEHPGKHPETPGQIWDLGPGLTSAGFAFDGDSASAARVPPGVTLTLFDDEEGQGRRVVLPTGHHELHPLGFGDSVSSVRVAREGTFDPATPSGPADAVQLHQHLPREGDLGEAWSLRLPRARTTHLFRATDGHFLNNEASAAWIPSGYEVTLFENGDGLGRALVLGPGFHELLPFDFNDRASSARVRRVKGELR